MIESFRDLNVWKKAMDFVVEVYSQTEELPASERFGLISQIRRAAVSIPSNIAEGKAVGGQRYRRHLKYALGSEAELHTQIELARRLNMLGEASTSALLQDLSGVGRMITALLQALPRD